MTPHKESEDGWIEWSGGECPVGPREEVYLRTDMGDSSAKFIGAEVQWDNSRRQIKLRAYRVVHPK